MNKIFLIIEREYMTRVRKKSFIIMSVLGPILIASIYIIPIWFATHGGEKISVEVLDHSRLFINKFKDTDKLTFVNIEGSLEQSSKIFELGNSDALLYIPNIDIDKPEGIIIKSKQGLSFATQSIIENLIEEEIENKKFADKGIDKTFLDNIKADVSIKVFDLEENISNTAFATGIAFTGAIMIYFFIFLYGAQVMRGVIEEKTNRIIEVIISSVKPFELMIGKIVGIAGVGLTQLLIWVFLGFAVLTASATIIGFDQKTITEGQNQVFQQNQDSQDIKEQISKGNWMEGFSNINFPLIISCFIFYFLFGYLMYAALFGAIGAAVDSETDSQQFMLPVTIPLILSIVMASAVINEPNGSIAFWMSMIPLTSPVIMMIRIPFMGASWEVLLSMILLVLGFLATTWLAAKIYRVGILMYGKKPTYKEISKWLFYK